MVSALWKASAEGNLENVLDLLNTATALDIEIKDHNGVTPLIEAIRNGHVEVVRALLDKGADPSNGSTQGLPSQYTSDPAILDLLNFAQNKISSGMPSNEVGYGHDVPNAEKGYYGPPPGAYPYYPSITSPPHLPEGAMYYPPPPPPPDEHQAQGGPPNLPPPEVARFIPCRYFPACRYGSSCLFAHPQAPYFQGPLPPPAQYPAPYDPMAPQPFSPNYYPVPPPSFPPPNGIHHMSPMSPPSGPHHTPSHTPVHVRSGSEIVSPPQLPFNPPGPPPPLPYGAMSPMSAYPHPGQVPVPLSIPSVPPLHHQPPQQGHHSAHSMYNNVSPPVPSFAVRQDALGQYPPDAADPQGPYPDGAGPKSPILHPQRESYSPSAMFRDGNGHNRRGSVRRGSFGGGGRKPPCLFFPSGRCKNGNDCRFPHILPEGPGPHHPPYYAGRGGPRPRGHANGNAFGTIEEKMAGMTVRDDVPSHQQIGVEGSSRSHSTDPGSRGRFHQTGKSNHIVNGVKAADGKKTAFKQRVPNADEFPVLAGATTPPARSPGLNGWVTNGNGHTPTAAQVLQRPPPSRRDSTKEPSTRDATPDPAKSIQLAKADSNSNSSEISHESTAAKPTASFAAVATVAPDVAKEISVSA